MPDDDGTIPARSVLATTRSGRPQFSCGPAGQSSLFCALAHRRNGVPAVRCPYACGWSIEISLTHYAAEALIGDYLNGRTLPLIVHTFVVCAAQTRLVEGKVPVLDESLRRIIDEKAIGDLP